MNLYKSQRQMVGHLVNTFVVLAELLLALRVVLKFAVAEADASFVHWAFRVTDPLLDPFRGIFTNPTASTGSWVIDFPALLAMAVYAAVGYMLVSLAARLAPSFSDRRK
ncbi:YggT family protein [Candidatus Saccharibacteria bacterium]|nr:YggT family protein [Candidatus Saccharibacteria bacterium]